MIYRGYEPARSCTGSATSGAKAMMSYWLGAYGHLGAVNSGIYNCREVRGGGSYSLHAEGRADDLGVRPYKGSYGAAFAEKCRLYSGELGLQLGIWNRGYWSGSYPDRGWMPYSGVSPHEDHIHLELSWASARTLTVPRIQEVFAGGLPESRAGRPVILQGSTGEAVRELQVALRIEVDGIFGPGTEAAVRAFQTSRGIPADGIVGPATWAALLPSERKRRDMHIEVTYNEDRSRFQISGRLDANSEVNQNNVWLTWGVLYGNIHKAEGYVIAADRSGVQILKDGNFDFLSGGAVNIRDLKATDTGSKAWRMWTVHGELEATDRERGLEPVVTAEVWPL